MRYHIRQPSKQFTGSVLSMADYNYINSTGVIIPDTATVKAEVEAEYKEVYGADFIVDSSTEQGRQIDAEVTSRMSVLRNNAKLANQINPNLAEDAFLDAIYALANGERDGETFSTTVCTIGGVTGTIIQPSSGVAIDANGNEWVISSPVMIPASGSVDSTFKAVVSGPISALAGEINTMKSGGVLGWETITNVSSSTVGSNAQNDVATRRKRKIELGGNAINNTLAIITAISKVDNVNSLTFRENNESEVKVIDEVSMRPNSTYVCVDGGGESDIANAYYKARSGGSDFTGDVEVVVIDGNSLQPMPVRFSRPTERPKFVRISVKSSSGDYLSAAIKQAIVDYADGKLSGETGFVVGGNVSAFEIAAAVNSQVDGVFVSKCEIAEVQISPTYTTETIVTKVFEKATVNENNITVTIL